MCSCLRSPVPADGACIAAAGAITRLSEEEKKGSDKEESASALSARDRAGTQKGGHVRADALTYDNHHQETNASAWPSSQCLVICWAHALTACARWR